MEITSLCFRLLILDFILLGTQVQNHYTQGSGSAFLRITPNRLQHFQLESVSFHCEGSDGSTQLKRIRNTEEFVPQCDTKRTPTGSLCTVDRAYPEDSGEYWCETNGGKTSNRVNITITAGSVILGSPALPVLEGDNATLHCRNKTISNLLSDFYKDDLLIESSSTGEMTILSVSKADEGLYKCRISAGETSPGSWLVVRADSVILDSPVLPVMEGYVVTLYCRSHRTSNKLLAKFYKDGVLMQGSPAEEITMNNVSKSDEGLYKCSTSSGETSPGSWLAVRGVK
ncbi:Fc receptor-like A [Morone saxatilis]|uniref:Fc receptor-like A n=1 Tax=Morone saxatilis TaxID=34816 RepID=UPI0015E2290D|nr:Fc receptor-like A [Morone saxatilis]